MSIVTIAIPTYNRASKLPRAVESVLAQTFQEFELLISDNCSTDGTRNYCDAIASAVEQCRYIRRERTVSAAENFKSLLELASGDLFMWLADDDWLDPDYLQSAVKVLAENPDASLANSPVFYHGEMHELKYSDPAMCLLSESPSHRVAQYLREVGRNGAFYGVYRTDAVREAFFGSGIGSDWVFLASIANAGKVVPMETILHRSDDGGSKDLEALVKSYGRPGFYLASNSIYLYEICANFAYAIIAGKGCFGKMPISERVGLSRRCVIAIRRHKIVESPAATMRALVSYGRRRVRFVLRRALRDDRGKR